MDADLVLITIASLITFTVVPWIILSGLAKVKRAGASPATGQLRRSDLEAIVRGAVEEANAPVLRRLETLESLAADGLPISDRIDARVVAEALDDPEGDLLPTDRSRTRS